MSLHDKKFPNESQEYRDARNQILTLEIELRARVEMLGKMREKLPVGGRLKEDYVFEQLDAQGNVQSVRFSDLFSANKTTLVVYSFMYGEHVEDPCPACTSFLDGINGSIAHINDRVDFVVSAKSPIQRIEDFAHSRDWSMNLVSCLGNSYNNDYFAENTENRQMPALNIFKKMADGIYHFYNTELLYAPTEGHPRHIDNLWPVWNLLDLTPEGRGENWFPQLSYTA